jgi:hypothetical protein
MVMDLVMGSAYAPGVQGQIVRRGNTWRVHIYLGADASTGKQRYLTRTVRGTKRDAEKVRAALGWCSLLALVIVGPCIGGGAALGDSHESPESAIPGGSGRR